MDLADLTAVEAGDAIRTGKSSCADLIEACIARIEAREAEIQAWEYFDAGLCPCPGQGGRCETGRGKTTRPVALGCRSPSRTLSPPPTCRHKMARRSIVDVSRKRMQRAYACCGKPAPSSWESRSPRSWRTWRRARRAIRTTLITRPADRRRVRQPQLHPAWFRWRSAPRPADRSFDRPRSAVFHGIKPTLGLISRTGVTLQSHTLDTVGVYGKSLADLALILDVLSQSDPTDAVSYPRARPRLAEVLQAAEFPDPRIAFCETPAWELAEPRGAGLRFLAWPNDWVAIARRPRPRARWTTSSTSTVVSWALRMRTTMALSSNVPAIC